VIFGILGWLIPFNMMISISIHFPENDSSIFLYGSVIFHGICIIFSLCSHHLLDTLLIPQFSCCRQSCNKHGYEGVSRILTYAPLGKCPRAVRWGHR
jgi:hypothetical protein